MKETKIEKLILDLSTRWEVSPEEAVDRLNSMNESEINKLINSMTKKFKNGGFIDCLRNGGSVEKCKCGQSIGVKKAQRGMPILPSMHYREITQSVPVQMGYVNTNLNVGTVRTDGNGAAVFEGNFKRYPDRVISTPSDLGINESVLDRVNRSKAFHDKMQAEGVLKASDPGVERKESGGMMDCLRTGNTISKRDEKIAKAANGMVADGNWRDYHTIINAPGDTLRFKQYYSGPVTMQTHPEGGVTYTKSTKDGITHMHSPEYTPNLWERLVLRMRPVDRDTEQNWKQLIKNHKNDPAVKDKTKKK